MARIYHEVPDAYVEPLFLAGIKRQCALAHHFVNNDSLLTKYENLRERGLEIYLDNGAYEGAIVSNASLVDTAIALQPLVLVLPDQRNDGYATLGMIQVFLRDYEHMLRRFCPRTLLMGVVHGETREIWFDVLGCLGRAHSRIDVLGFSRESAGIDPKDALSGLRDNVVQIIHRWIAPSKKIHLLTLDRELRELSVTNVRKFVFSIDTSKIVAHALGIAQRSTEKISTRAEDHTLRPPGFFETPFNTDTLESVVASIKISEGQHV